MERLKIDKYNLKTHTSHSYYPLHSTMKLTSLLYLTVQIQSILALGFSGKITNVPDQLDELHHHKNVQVVNGDNYQARINIELIPLTDDSDDIKRLQTLVDEEYKFQYEDLAPGSYELLVNSYDFVLSNNRYRIIVDDYVQAYEDYLHEPKYNETSRAFISHEKPLEIQFIESKQFYEFASGSLGEMVMNSPLGVIFKNKYYTMFFVFSLVIIAAPYVLSFISPEFAEQFNDVKVESVQDKAERLEAKENIRRLDPTKPQGSSTGVRTPQKVKNVGRKNK